MANLDSLFASLCRYRGIPRSEVDEIASLIPEPIRRTPAFLDRMTGLWRYDFGEPFVGLPAGGVVLGTQMFQEVDRLYDVLSCARRRLAPQALQTYLARLADPKKHADLIFEFSPIVRLPINTEVEYEVSGLGQGNSTIDWWIKPASGPSIVLDVKNRTRDLLESFARLQAGERDPDGTAPAPVHDPDILFRSGEQKFESRNPTDIVQCLWIGTGLKQEESELRAAFNRLDRMRVHVAFLGDWEDDVCTRSPTIRLLVNTQALFWAFESHGALCFVGIKANYRFQPAAGRSSCLDEGLLFH